MPYKDIQRRRENYAKWLSRPGNRERIRKYTLEYYHKNGGKEKNRKWYHNNLEREREKQRKNNWRNRTIVLSLLGGKCERCGFTDIRALQVDHISGSGTQDRKMRGHSTSAIVSDIKKNPKKYQLLCANCNWIKRHENKELFITRHKNWIN